MGALARRRGVRVVRGAAEALPFDAGVFDGVVMVTTICFVDDPLRAMEEARRVLRPGGALVIGFVDADSPLGRAYRRRARRSRFYREATFYTYDDLTGLLRRAGFRRPAVRQTLFGSEAPAGRPEPVRPGHGRGAFLVLRAVPRLRRTGASPRRRRARGGRPASGRAATRDRPRPRGKAFVATGVRRGVAPARRARRSGSFPPGRFLDRAGRAGQASSSRGGVRPGGRRDAWSGCRRRFSR
jgi:SAM-dependent methyltransferase